jgi:hypothetical protein
VGPNPTTLMDPSQRIFFGINGGSTSGLVQTSIDVHANPTFRRSPLA